MITSQIPSLLYFFVRAASPIFLMFIMSRFLVIDFGYIILTAIQLAGLQLAYVIVGAIVLLLYIYSLLKKDRMRQILMLRSGIILFLILWCVAGMLLFFFTEARDRRALIHEDGILPVLIFFVMFIGADIFVTDTLQKLVKIAPKGK